MDAAESPAKKKKKKKRGPRNGAQFSYKSPLINQMDIPAREGMLATVRGPITPNLEQKKEERKKEF